ncbi:hypothetical protein [Janthinobacterium sp.]
MHNALGWVYPAAILPFHFLIVRRQLERIAARHFATFRDEPG